MAKLFKLDGSTIHIEPSNKAKGFSLKECYEYIECGMIEVLRVDEHEFLVFDEEGSLKVNPQVNTTVLKKFKIMLFGNVLLCNDKEFK